MLSISCLTTTNTTAAHHRTLSVLVIRGHCLVLVAACRMLPRSTAPTTRRDSSGIGIWGRGTLAKLVGQDLSIAKRATHEIHRNA